MVNIGGQSQFKSLLQSSVNAFREMSRDNKMLS